MNDNVKRFRDYLACKENLKRINEIEKMIDEEFEEFQKSNNNSESKEQSRDKED